MAGTSHESRFRSFFEALPVALYMSTPDGSILDANPALVRLVGYASRDALIGTDSRSLYVDPDDRDRWKTQLLEEGVIRGCEVQLRRLDGEVVWVRETARVVRSDDTGEMVFQGIMEDVTREKGLAESARRNVSRFRRLFESARDAIFLMDDGLFVDANPAAERMFGLSVEKLRGLGPFDLSPDLQPSGERSSEAGLARIRTAESGKSQFFDWRHRRADGEEFDAEVSLAPVDADGRIRLQAIVRDVTQRRRWTTALARRSVILEAAAFAAQTLLHSASWEDAAAQILEALGRAAGVSRAYLYRREDRDSQVCALRHTEWIAEESAPSSVGTAMITPELDGIGSWLPRLLAGETVLARASEASSPVRAFLDRSAVRSLVLVPVIVGGKAWGAIGFDDCVAESTWSEGEVEALRVAAGVLGAAVSTGEARRELERRTSQLEIRSRIDELLASELDATRVLQEIAEQLRTSCELDHVSVAVVEDDPEVLRFAAWAGYESGATPRTMPIGGSGLIAQAARAASSVYAGDVRDEPTYVCGDASIRSEYAVPLVSHGEVVGVLNCESRQVDGIGPWVRQIVDRVARQGSVALRNASIYRHIEASEREHRELSGRLETLRVIDRGVLSGASLREVGRAAVQWLRRLVPCERASILRFDKEGGRVEVLAVSQDEPLGHAEGTSLPLALAINIDLLRRRAVHKIDDLSQLETIPPVLREALDRGMNSTLTIVLQAENRLVGTLNLLSREVAAFSSSDVDIASQVAEELSLALSQVELRAAVAAERERLHGLLEHLPEGVLLLDGRFRITVANRSGLEALEALGAARSGRLDRIRGFSLPVLVSRRAELPVEVTADSQRIFEIRVSAVGDGDGEWVLVLRDVTSERETERKLQLQARLAAVGQLAAGIAHDFNNMLQAIQLNSEIVTSLLGAESPATERLEVIREQARRGGKLVRQILDFARESVTRVRPLAVGQFLNDAMRLLGSAVPETIDVRVELPDGDPHVLADAGQMQQLLTNLVVNSVDAMPDGGVLTIRARKIDVPQDEAPYPGMQPGRWVELAVTDTGRGISTDIRDRVFEPFFTTKAPDRKSVV